MRYSNLSRALGSLEVSVGLTVTAMYIRDLNFKSNCTFCSVDTVIGYMLVIKVLQKTLGYGEGSECQNFKKLPVLPLSTDISSYSTSIELIVHVRLTAGPAGPVTSRNSVG